jgi:hypothetical protein
MSVLNRIYGQGMVSGEHPVVGDLGAIRAIDLIAVNEWGPCEPNERTGAPDPGDVNRRLASMALEAQAMHPHPVPIVGTMAVQIALSQVSGKTVEVKYLVEDAVGTHGEVERTKAAMDEDKHKVVLVLAQANHAGRAALLLEHAGIQAYASPDLVAAAPQYVIPPNLPRGFRPESHQLGIRKKSLFVAHEVAVGPVLLALGKL